MVWSILTAIASLVSMVAFVVTAVLIRAELRAQEKDRYLSVTNDLFSIWQSPEFMEAQLWLLHKLDHTTWQDFVEAHRGDAGEIAFHRVGSFYDRLGTMVRLGFVNDREILSTTGGYAIAVWKKIEPLVREARRIENSVLFDDFERILPACHVCYVPNLQPGTEVFPFSIAQTADRVTTTELRRRLKRGDAITLLDSRQPDDVAREPEPIPGAIFMAPDSVAAHYKEIPPDRDVVVYCT